jgi:hypothetical protein
MPPPQTPTATAQQPKEIRKSPRTLKREAVERRKARYEQAQLEYDAAEKKAAARKKLNARKPSAKRKRANSTKEKTPPGKQNKPSTGKGAQKVDFDLLDDEDHDDDDDGVGGKDDGGIDDDNPTTNNEIDEDVNGNYNPIVGKAKVDNDENKDDPSYHDDDEDSSSTSGSEPSMPPADFDTETEDAPVENGKDTGGSGRQRIYEKKRRDGDRRGVSTTSSHTAAMSVQPIQVVRTQTAAATIPPGMDRLIHIRGMSRSESLKCRQKFVTQRLNTFVKTDLFRKIKFVNSDTGLQRAMKKVMDHEDVQPQHRLNFQRIYETAFSEALNTKRSACEQSAGKIVRKTIDEFEESLEEFFTMDEVMKLRRATTDRERKAFFWFFDKYIECVSGKRLWGAKKVVELVSKATDNDAGQNNAIVTKSDEAFALLIFENYEQKWKSQRETLANNGNIQRMKGKYTGRASGHCKYGGWNAEGIRRFNELRNLVEEDRASPQAEIMEKELLQYCRNHSKRGGNHGGDTCQEDQQGDNNTESEVRNATFEEAGWDSDE